MGLSDCRVSRELARQGLADVTLARSQKQILVEKQIVTQVYLFYLIECRYMTKELKY